MVTNGFFDYSGNTGSPLANWAGFTSYQSMVASGAGFFLYCFLPLLPLALVSLKRFGNFQLRSWLVLSLILMLTPIAIGSIFRWVLMLTYPFAFYVAETLSMLKAVNWKRFKLTVHRVALLYLVFSTVILSVGLMLSTPEAPFFYFKAAENGGGNFYINEIPSSMLQNTLPITDCKDTVNALQWFKITQNSSAMLLTHTVFFGWAFQLLI